MAAITYLPYLPRRCHNSNRGIWKATHAISADLYTVVGYERALERRYFAPHKFLYWFPKSSERGSGQITLHIHFEHGNTLMFKLNFSEVIYFEIDVFYLKNSGQLWQSHRKRPETLFNIQPYCLSVYSCVLPSKPSLFHGLYLSKASLI